MKHSTLVTGSLVAVGIFIVLFCVGLVTGYPVARPVTSTGTLSDTNTGGQTATTVHTAVEPGQYITIDPIAGTTTGELLTVKGSTDLPAGTILMVQAGSPGVGYGGDTIVRTGTGGVNRFSAPVDTAMLKPGSITITVTRMTGDLATRDYRMGTLNATATITLNGSWLGTDIPVQAPVTKDDYIRINTIGNRAVGDQFLITGITSLPVGTGLIWQIMPYTGTIPTALDLNATGIMANNAVTKGDGTANRVSLAVDTGNQAPGEYIVLVGEMKGDPSKMDIRIGDLVGSTRFTMN
jgi:hypothetical protein